MLLIRSCVPSSGIGTCEITISEVVGSARGASSTIDLDQLAIYKRISACAWGVPREFPAPTAAWLQNIVASSGQGVKQLEHYRVVATVATSEINRALSGTALAVSPCPILVNPPDTVERIEVIIHTRGSRVEICGNHTLRRLERKLKPVKISPITSIPGYKLGWLIL
jgi:hypothetical protein